MSGCGLRELMMIYAILSPIVANLIPAAIAVFLLWQAPISPLLGIIGRRFGIDRSASPQESAEALRIRRGYGPETPWIALGLAVALSCMFVKAHDDYTIKVLRATVVEMEPTVEPPTTEGDGLSHFMGFGDGTESIMREGCTEGCAGHVAGWKWAAKHRALKVSQCEGSNSPSFADGCRIYLWRMGYAPEPE